MRLSIVFPTLFLVAGVAAMAAPLLQDPRILIDSGGDAIPISSGINEVQPNGNQTVSFDFFNDTSAIVTSFTFQTTINTGLSSAEAALFTCADPGGYFLGCHTTYDSLTGHLRYLFSGVNAEDADENGSDPEINEQEGIPPSGHFIITLDGWTENETLFVDGTPPALNNNFTTEPTPEPAVALTLGAGLLLLGAIRRRAVR
jgi:hypothetical protein